MMSKAFLKKHTYVLVAVFLLSITLLFGLMSARQFFSFFHEEWTTYTNTTYSFSFNYPKKWGTPTARYENQQEKDFSFNFSNGELEVSNGHYFTSINGLRPNVNDMLRGFKMDQEVKNEIMNFNTEQSVVNRYPARKVSVTNLDGSRYIFMFIEYSPNNNDWLLIKGDLDQMSNEVFDKIILSFRYPV